MRSRAPSARRRRAPTRPGGRAQRIVQRDLGARVTSVPVKSCDPEVLDDGRRALVSVRGRHSESEIAMNSSDQAALRRGTSARHPEPTARREGSAPRDRRGRAREVPSTSPTTTSADGTPDRGDHRRRRAALPPPRALPRTRATRPKGILLYGPPGAARPSRKGRCNSLAEKRSDSATATRTSGATSSTSRARSC